METVEENAINSIIQNIYITNISVKYEKPLIYEW